MIRNYSPARRAATLGVVMAAVVAAASFNRLGITSTAPQIPYAKYPQLVRVWMHGDMIYPPIARVREGKILLRAENRTEIDATLILERVAGNVRQNTRVSTVSRALRAEMVFTIDAGEYEFYDEKFPEARGKLIVVP